MALRQNKPINRVADSTLTPEDKLRINKKARKQGEEVIFPFERDEGGIFNYPKDIQENLQDKPDTELQKYLKSTLKSHIDATSSLMNRICTNNKSKGFIYNDKVSKYGVILNVQEFSKLTLNIIEKLRKIKKKLSLEDRSDDFFDKEVLDYLNVNTQSKLGFFASKMENKQEISKLQHKFIKNVSFYIKSIQNLDPDSCHSGFSMDFVENNSGEISKFQMFLTDFVTSIKSIEKQLFSGERSDDIIDDDMLVFVSSSNKGKTIADLFKKSKLN